MVTTHRIRKMTAPYHRIQTTHTLSIFHAFARVRWADNIDRACMFSFFYLDGTHRWAFPYSMIYKDSLGSDKQEGRTGVHDDTIIDNFQTYKLPQESLLIPINNEWRHKIVLYGRSDLIHRV
jgi:hypothetical protein